MSRTDTVGNFLGTQAPWDAPRKFAGDAIRREDQRVPRGSFLAMSQSVNDSHQSPVWEPSDQVSVTAFGLPRESLRDYTPFYTRQTPYGRITHGHASICSSLRLFPTRPWSGFRTDPSDGAFPGAPCPAPCRSNTRLAWQEEGRGFPVPCLVPQQRGPVFRPGGQSGEKPRLSWRIPRYCARPRKLR